MSVGCSRSGHDAGQVSRVNMREGPGEFANRLCPEHPFPMGGFDPSIHKPGNPEAAVSLDCDDRARFAHDTLLSIP